MLLKCTVQLQDLNYPNISFKRSVQSHLYLGAISSDNKEPVLIFVTSRTNIKYKVKNIKKVCKNEIHHGKISICLHTPSHLLLIRSNYEKLSDFLNLLHILASKSKSINIPVILKVEKPTVQSRVTPEENDSVIRQIMPMSLREKLKTSIRELNLPNSRIKTLPIELGQVSLYSVNLENNILHKDDLLWLEELIIRKSLQSLNLTNNKLQCFPSVLVDFHSLNVLDLRNNNIQYIPGTIGRLRSLRSLNLSGNNIRYLPASIATLKLNKVDLTYNNLRSSKCHYSREQTENFRNYLRLEDLAAMKVDPLICRYLTTKDCPRILLEKLRCLSQCICGKRTVPFHPAQFFKTIKGNEHFATTEALYPQKSAILSQSKIIYLQFHFCKFLNRCENHRFRLSPPFICFNLL